VYILSSGGVLSNRILLWLASFIIYLRKHTVLTFYFGYLAFGAVILVKLVLVNNIEQQLRVFGVGSITTGF
jgi:hypothetical protein